MAEQSVVDCDPRNPTFYEDPFATYSRWHAENPVFYWQQYGMVCFAGYSDVNTLLRDNRFGRQITHKVSREALGWAPRPAALADFDRVELHSLLNLEPPRHTTMRALVNKAFIGREIEALRPTVESLVHRTIDSFINDREVELLSRFAMPVPAQVIASMIGMPGEAVPDLLAWSHALVKVYTRQQTPEEDVQANRAAAEFSSFLHDVIRDKRLSPKNDLLSRLISVQQDGQSLSDDEIVSTVVLLLNAGHEASVHLMGNAVATLLAHPDQIERIRADATSIAGIAQEVMRFCTPLHLFTRYALEDVELEAGLKIKRGDEVGLLLGAANRDPVRFIDPNQFNPDRPVQGHLSLGAGIHYCVGAVLARMELEIALVALFTRLPSVSLNGPLQIRDSFHFHGLDALNLRW